LVVARYGSPVLIGLHDEIILIASEKIAFEKYTSNYVSLQDLEIKELDLKGAKNHFRNQ
jgi:glucosamine--fructose-6-phosphate aminotransferase (isomerizing)